MSFLTKKEIAERLDIKINSLSGFIQSDPRASRFFYKKYMLIDYIDKNGVHKVRQHNVYGLDSKNLIAFKRFWETKNIKPKIDHNALLSWTNTSIECYKRRMQCAVTCSSYEYCKELKKMNNNIPPIKEKVIELYQKLGKPIGE